MTTKDKMRIAEGLAYREYNGEQNSNFYAFRSGVVAGINYILELEANLHRDRFEEKLTEEEYKRHGGKL